MTQPLRMTNPRLIADPPRVLRIVIEGEPVPAQMGAILPNGRVARKGTERVRAFKDRVGLLTMLAVNRCGWRSSQDHVYSMTARFFMGNARVIDLDNACKSLLDGIKGVAFPDDRQVIELHLYKQISRDKPRVEVTVERLHAEASDERLERVAGGEERSR